MLKFSLMIVYSVVLASECKRRNLLVFCIGLNAVALSVAPVSRFLIWTNVPCRVSLYSFLLCLNSF